MIRPVNQSDLKKIDKLIGNEYFKCLYLFMDLKKYGIKDENVKIWIQEEKKNIYTVILKYYSGMHLFSNEIEYKIEEVIDLIDKENPSIICGEKNVIQNIENNLRNPNYKSEYGWVRKLNKIKSEKEGEGVKAKKDDFYTIAKLIYEDEDLGSSYKLDELANQMYQRFIDGYTRNYVIKKDNKVVSHVATGAEYRNIAMVAYVVTDKEYRKQGLASKLLIYICKQLMKENKEIFLINYSRESSILYDKIGFDISCEWGKLFLNMK